MELDEAQLLDALALLQVPMGTLGWLAQKCISSPYGRYVTPGGRCQLPARVSWVLQELPSLVLPLLLLLRAPPGTPTPNLLLLSMFVLHYVQRSLIFPLLIRGGKPTPVYVFLLAFLYCTFNGYLQGRYLTRHAVYAEDWLTDPRFLGGSLLWLLGLMINLHSDHILRNLREPGETGYKIPRGGTLRSLKTTPSPGKSSSRFYYESAVSGAGQRETAAERCLREGPSLSFPGASFPEGSFLIIKHSSHCPSQTWQPAVLAGVLKYDG
ncbi:3-oxo-5-alpha-steroid 4-dehydrogenase 1 isoform X1 [Erinaceus europaeus]|uniref:3-oxo-5-alpha-steroid 4-dehydrogenase 1 isoform X1 n=1 Tax=Erinaceus europaeus TaxID=9365 RepID=A0ABM3XE69_ERIEU|nr:3-oxo-5-alpha-steroid 4-dehydrogenase 1 isoform X1 [Erinaceus europaeus]